MRSSVACRPAARPRASRRRFVVRSGAGTRWRSMFSADFVLDVLDCAPDAIVDGGWGIDALIGRVTRVHDDLDLVVPIAHVEELIDALRPLGFIERVDEPPARIVLSTLYDQRVDLHVVTPTERGMVQEVDGGGR